MRYAKAHMPSVVICENVATMTHRRKEFGNECPIEIQKQCFKRLGYSGCHYLLNTRDFGIPQSRTRCWSFYIKSTDLVPGFEQRLGVQLCGLLRSVEQGSANSRSTSSSARLCL